MLITELGLCFLIIKFYFYKFTPKLYSISFDIITPNMFTLMAEPLPDGFFTNIF
jgi:hypothetical protein